MPNWKKVILSGSDASLKSVTVSGNILPDSDNVRSLGASDNRFLLNGGTPVTVTGSGTANTITRFQGATTVEDSNIFSSDTLTRLEHSNNGNDIFIVSGSNGQMITVSDEVGDEIFRVNDNSGLELFTVSGSGRLVAPNLVFRDSDSFVLSYESASGEISFKSASTADFDTMVNKPTLFSGSAQVVASLNNQDLDLGTGDLTATDLRIAENGTGFRMTNIGAFENSSGFHIFSNNNLRFSTNGSGNERLRLTSAGISGSVPFSGSFVGDGSGLTGTRYEEAITGNTSYTITHNLDEDYPIVQVYNTNKEQVLPGIISASNSNTVLLEFDTNFTGRVIVKK